MDTEVPTNAMAPQIVETFSSVLPHVCQYTHLSPILSRIFYKPALYASFSATSVASSLSSPSIFSTSPFPHYSPLPQPISAFLLLHYSPYSRPVGVSSSSYKLRTFPKVTFSYITMDKIRTIGYSYRI